MGVAMSEKSLHKKRSTIVLFVFLSVFTVGSGVFVFVNSSYNFALVVKIFIIPALASLFLGGKILLDRRQQPISVKELSQLYKIDDVSTVSKYQIAGACYGTSIAIGILLVTLMLVAGLYSYIKYFMYFYLTLGVAIVFAIFWPFYKKHLKQ